MNLTITPRAQAFLKTMHAIETHYGVPRRDIISRQRSQPVAHARGGLMEALHRAGFPTADIAGRLGLRLKSVRFSRSSFRNTIEVHSHCRERFGRVLEMLGLK